MEMAEKLVRKEIEVKRDFVSKAKALSDVVQKFDGKILNKRLETAMREVYPVRVEIEKDWNWVHVTGYIADRSVQSDDVDKWGYHSYAYIKDDRIYIASCARNLTDENGRLYAEELIELIRDEAKRQKEYADKLEEQLGRIDEIKAECRRIHDECVAFAHNTSAQIREYYGLEV